MYMQVVAFWFSVVMVACPAGNDTTNGEIEKVMSDCFVLAVLSDPLRTSSGITLEVRKAISD